MVSFRKTLLANNEIYHVYNRGVEKRIVFIDRRDYKRALDTISYYRYANPPLRFSHFTRLSKERKRGIFTGLGRSSKYVDVLSYCLMPNHFHFLIKQRTQDGISKFIGKVTNSYTKYFNTKYDRVGSLFQGVFKSAHIDSDDLLLHVSRYIHLNPVSSFLVKSEDLQKYVWSSFPEYMDSERNNICDTTILLQHFKNSTEYKEFVLDQVEHAQQLELMKHSLLEDV